MLGSCDTLTLIRRNLGWHSVAGFGRRSFFRPYSGAGGLQSQQHVVATPTSRPSYGKHPEVDVSHQDRMVRKPVMIAAGAGAHTRGKSVVIGESCKHPIIEVDELIKQAARGV